MRAITQPETDGELAEDRILSDPWAGFPTPYIGRTARIVGRVENVDPKQLPPAKASRGELGKPLYNWYTNTISIDPLSRVAFTRHAADLRNVLMSALQSMTTGGVNPSKQTVDPYTMSKHIKRVGKHLGADIVGIGATHPAFLMKSRTMDGVPADDGQQAESAAEIARQYPYMILTPVAWDDRLMRAHRHRIGDAAYDFTLQQTRMITIALEGYIKELGYKVLRGAVNPTAAALASGVGELGRNGLIISEQFGARINLGDPILTDLPLAPDRPIDLGVDDFCKICRKCAITCPTNSITFEGKQVLNGVEKYKIKWDTCYKLRPFVAEHYGNCLTCVAVCPYTKPNVWWRRLAIKALQLCPIPLRPGVVRSLKWVDDAVWGTVPKRRVRWLGYDSGIKPGETACTIAGCTASHGESSGATKIDVPLANVGYYAPLKENTNRFVKR